MRETEKDILHRQKVAQHLSEEGRKYFELIEFDADEELVTEIRKHPFGLALVLITGAFVTIMILAAGVFGAFVDFASIFGANEADGLGSVLVLISFLLSMGTLIMTLIAAFLYKSNVIFVTSEKIAQVLYMSLFNRKISQLSIGDVQDVTVTQKGVLAHFFNYGTLVVETAGEQENYRFTYVPEPYQTSKMIVGAHERNLVKHGN